MVWADAGHAAPPTGQPMHRHLQYTAQRHSSNLHAANGHTQCTAHTRSAQRGVALILRQSCSMSHTVASISRSTCSAASPAHAAPPSPSMAAAPCPSAPPHAGSRQCTVATRASDNMRACMSRHQPAGSAAAASDFPAACDALTGGHPGMEGQGRAGQGRAGQGTAWYGLARRWLCVCGCRRAHSQLATCSHACPRSVGGAAA